MENLVAISETEDGEFLVEVIGIARPDYDDDYCDTYQEALGVSEGLSKEIRDEYKVEVKVVE